MSTLASLPARTLAIAVALAVAVLAALAYCRPKPAPIPRAEQRSLDSLAATAPTYTTVRDTLIQRETVYVRQSAVHAAQAVQALRSANVLHDSAIVLERVAEAARDTASRWYAVAITRGLEADSLRVAVGTLTQSLTFEASARIAADTRASNDSARLAASLSLNARLAHDVTTADRCRVLLVLSCPSRRVAALAGAILGAGATYALTRTRP